MNQFACPSCGKSFRLYPWLTRYYQKNFLCSHCGFLFNAEALIDRSRTSIRQPPRAWPGTLELSTSTTRVA